MPWFTFTARETSLKSLYPTAEVEEATIEQPIELSVESTAFFLSSEVKVARAKHTIQKSVNESQEEYDLDKSMEKSFAQEQP
jgi:hypothetical protein